MEITVTGRHVQVSDRFRRLLEEKLTKVELYAPRTQRIDVVVTLERSKSAKNREGVEITCVAKGPVIRAEAYSVDKYAALDLAIEKLAERLRRAGDRRRVSRRRGVPQPDPALLVAPGEPSLPPLAEDTPAADATDTVDVEQDRFGAQGDSPIHVREKTHASPPMTLDQALYEMELVGHDFFLYHDRDTDKPSVVYKRRGWEYGVLHLEVTESITEESAAMPQGAAVGAG